MAIVGQIIFLLLLGTAGYFFSKQAGKVKRNILLGKDIDRKDRQNERLAMMLRVAFGQSKMFVRIIPGLLHFFVYAGFLLINMEMLEIVTDGLLGSHRIFAPILGSFYSFLTASFEVFMALVTLGCFAFLMRRLSNVVPRISNASVDLKGWATKDANIILYTEMILMSALMIMNASDQVLQSRSVEHYIQAGYFPISSVFVPLFSGFSDTSLIVIERACWWVHILGILAFLNYLPHSKHFHIMLAFPNVYFSKLTPKGQLTNDDFIRKEVQSMYDPTAEGNDPNAEMKLGAKDVFDLTWKQLLESYTCTECGRCTSVCPANITGKKLSPRKIMMATRDRLEEVGKNIDKNNGTFVDDGKLLLNDYITPEELWACTTCNACANACPVNIDPVSIVVELRRYLVMDQSAAPEALNHMFVKVENNGNPWGNAPTDRFEWANNIEIPS